MSHSPIPNLPISLLSLRVTIFVVMGMWTLDKFVNTEHAAAIYEGFYFLPGVPHQLLLVLAALEALLLLVFVLGLAKTWTYGTVLALHTVSTLSSFQQYLNPFEGAHLLFFAAWPMLAACITLFLLREHDRMLSL